ncbi:3-methyl-2-oxobutanoate hydroxymethyltransferase [Achromobacter sp. GG226]|uniref:3-methyl-2-oxobutanoate hydroxymethyltransferase n=1 Tax=Verticiella alkaliphila TaxID=2779529 RepID=UPI001C0AF198|nr:3-methyl-2-oxobutanoate hydroxymethyltransferase [Verticiella sp. GG226]MBU4610237.1 3-methyl-2-oxobutanoate hydroxymethyltransferase [Verticiella sp. GG226]
MRQTLSTLRKTLANGRKLSMLTCYEASFAQVMDAAGIDCLLVGDSLGMVVQGRDSTLAVTVEDIAYHTANIARGSRKAFLLADMPFGSYHESPAQAMRSAVRLMQAGAQMVKLEGGAELEGIVRQFVHAGIPVCAHVGLLPQHVHAIGGFRVQGKAQSDADRILHDAQVLEAAGAAMVLVEGVPEGLGRRIAETSHAITIGIGASVACDGQVLVMQDMLGLNASPARFVKDFTKDLPAGEGGIIERAFRQYAEEVADGRFPAAAHVYGLSGDDAAAYGGQRPATPPAA